MKTILALLFSVSVCIGQNMPFASPAFMSAAAVKPVVVALTCQAWSGQTQLTDNDNWNLAGGFASQKIHNTSSSDISICKIEMKFSGAGEGTDYTVWVSIWTTATESGSQLGADSSSITVPVTALATDWRTFTWSTPISVAGNTDFFVHFETTAGTASNVRWRANTGNGTGYETTSYPVYTGAGANAQTSSDFCFTLFIMQ
jgi:hypothetical protein